MADEPQIVRSIHWRELFPSTNLFRAFRIAIHPSKLVLGLLLVLALYAGGRFLDWVWPASSYPSRGEIATYTNYRWAQVRTPSFDGLRDQLRHANAEEYANRLVGAGIVTDRAQALDAAYHGRYYGALQTRIIADRNKQIADAGQQYRTQLQDLNTIKDDNERERRKRELNEQYESQLRDIRERNLSELESLAEIAPQPIFDEFLNYEARQFHNVVDMALSVNWLNGLSNRAMAPGVEFTRGQTWTAATARETARFAGPVSVVQSIANFTVVGPGWLVRYHLVYFILYLCWFLLIWAIFGGAIARVAAVHFARDEKISVRQALRFSFSKVLSFIFAPVIPMGILLALGVLLSIGGLIMYIPLAGPIIVGLAFFLALIAGFVMTLVVAGTAGGFNLMYPTIAVEGSDSFDAISRSFSYVFARPWKMLFYTIISLVYGALTFLFCRYFVYVMLGLTHFFVGWWLQGQPGRYWPEIWPPVSDENLAYHITFAGLAWSEAVGAVLISLWVYIVLGLLAGFVVSFYFSANTIIYYLMRREVDATEMDDVYLEEAEDDFGETSVVAPRSPEPSPTAPTGVTTSGNVVVIPNNPPTAGGPAPDSPTT